MPLSHWLLTAFTSRPEEILLLVRHDSWEQHLDIIDPGGHVPMVSNDERSRARDNDAGQGKLVSDIGLKSLLMLALTFAPAALFAQTKNPRYDQPVDDLRDPSRMDLDVRDAGVDCSFTRDSSAALSAIVAGPAADGRAITFPPGCHVKLENTWLIKNLSGFTIRGTSGAGNNGYFRTNVPTITWSGPQDGTMIDMQYVDGFVIENLAIDGGGTAAVGVNVDRFGPGGTVNTTDGIFRRLNVNANFVGVGNPKWVGLQFSMKQLNNVEDMRITDSVFYCGTTPTSGTAAIVIGPSYNPKNFKIEHNFIHLCNRAIWQQGGSVLIASNEIGSSRIDIQLDFWTDPNERIIDNLSESAESGDRFLLVTRRMDHPVEISGNNIAVNDTCAITLNGGEFYSGLGNTFYNGYGRGSTGHKICDLGDHGPLQLSGPGWLHNLTPEDFAYLEAVPIANGSAHSSIDAFGTTNVNEAILLGTGTRFVSRGTFYNRNDSAYGLGNNNSGGAIGSTSCDLNTICLYEGAGEIAGVASPDGLTCTVMGNGGTQTHSWFISAVDSLGNQTFPRSNASSSNCYHAPPSYDRDRYEMLSWVPSPNAVSYRLYLGNPSAPVSQIALVAEGITGTSYEFRGPIPDSFPLRSSDSSYNKTLIQLFRGREFDFQYGTPVKGFSDRDKTQKWSIDSLTGTGTFTKINGITDSTVVKNLNSSYLDGKQASDFAPAQGTVDGKDIVPKSIVTPVIRLQAGSSPTCDVAHRGQLSYILGGKGERDVVQICMKAADESYSWRVIY